jgi:sporulation protein YlmC with PRC-barrel domain
MNNKVDMKKQFFILGTAAAIAASVPSSIAAEAEVKADVDLPKVETRTEVKRDRDVEVDVDTKIDREQVRRSNKASGLLGMEVRNSENQKLGEVKDLVMDMDSGRVSYAVLSVGGFLGIGEKLIALPPTALKATEAGDHLLLNADKAKIQAAPGFAATAWPAPSDPQINQFWSDLRSTGSPATSETRRSGDVDVDADVDLDKKRSKVDVDTDKKKIYTDADKDKKVKVEVEKD